MYEVPFVMFAEDQRVCARFCDEIDEEDITIFEELNTNDWYVSCDLLEYMPDSVRAELDKCEQEELNTTPKSVWAWRVFTLALVVVCAWAVVRNW